MNLFKTLVDDIEGCVLPLVDISYWEINFCRWNHQLWHGNWSIKSNFCI